MVKNNTLSDKPNKTATLFFVFPNSKIFSYLRDLKQPALPKTRKFVSIDVLKVR